MWVAHPEMGKGALISKSAKLKAEAQKVKDKLVSAREFHLADQMYRSASSVGASIAEARGVGTRKHFAAKLRLARSECFELEYWLNAVSDIGYANDEDFQSLSSLQVELGKMLTSACKKLSKPKPK